MHVSLEDERSWRFKHNTWKNQGSKAALFVVCVLLLQSMVPVIDAYCTEITNNEVGAKIRRGRHKGMRA